MPHGLGKAVARRRAIVRGQRAAAIVSVLAVVATVGWVMMPSAGPAEPDRIIVTNPTPSDGPSVRFAEASVLALRLADPDQPWPTAPAAFIPSEGRPTVLGLRQRELAEGSSPAS
ncbi:MAG: hypothetical protein ACIAQU_11000 [Phycisphaerales bacterium JB064]